MMRLAEEAYLEVLLIAAGVVTAVIAIKLAIWAVATKPGWSRIREGALYAGFGVAATFAFFVITAWVNDTLFTIVAFAITLLLCFHVGKSLNQV
jgi:hypothetical protein